MPWIEDRWKGEAPDTSRRRWRVRYQTPDGSERSKSFDRKPAAETFRTEVAAELLHGSYRDPDAGKITLRKYALQWLDAQTFDEVSRESTEFRLKHILAGLGDKRMDHLSRTPSLVQAWLRNLKLAATTKRQCKTTLSSIFAAAIDDGRVIRNPCLAKSVKTPALADVKVVPLEQDELDALREALPPRYRAMVDAGASCGLRQGEIFGLAKDDIDFLRRMVHIRRQVKMVRGRLMFARPKGIKDRHVPLGADASLAFAEHIRTVPPVQVALPWHEPGGHRHGKPVKHLLLFTSPQVRKALSRQRFNNNVWKPALRKAGIADTRENGMHVLRHSFASVLLSRGLDIRTLSACLGHSNPAFTLKVYTHLMKGGDDRVRALLDTSAKGPEAAPGVAGK